MLVALVRHSLAHNKEDNVVLNQHVQHTKGFGLLTRLADATCVRPCVWLISAIPETTQRVINTQSGTESISASSPFRLLPLDSVCMGPLLLLLSSLHIFQLELRKGERCYHRSSNSASHFPLSQLTVSLRETLKFRGGIKLNLFELLLTVVSRSKAANLSSWAAAAFSKASCFLMRFSTSSMD